MNQDHFLITCNWDALNVNANRKKILWNSTKRCLNHVFLVKTLPGLAKPHAKTVVWSYDMDGNAQTCVERYCDLPNKKTEQLYKVFFMSLLG